ncbi:CPBP family intramembrane glutamic endopeptidase [Rhodococcus qingshengii]|uniref:CPBP family intramembrane glutamic endopeptidase n=1 Tax=Rhodococcus qingshengii TaxID=334542 RepID=UPI00360113B9
MQSTYRKASAILMAVAIATTIPFGMWFATGAASNLAELLGLAGDDVGSALGWLGAAAVTVGYITYTLWAVPFVKEHVAELSTFKLLGAWAAVTSSTLEEVIFRGVLMDELDSRGIGALGQIGVSAILFGVAHAMWMVMSREWSLVVPVVVSTALLGAALAVVYLLSERVLLPVVIAHVAVNLVIEPWLILSVVTRAWNPQCDI